MKAVSQVSLIGVVTALTALAALGGGDQFEITWFTIDGGGGVSTGGDFELRGTIGQPDAGFMSGGAFDLIGGFWFPIEPGDCNTDGGINLFDFETLDDCITGPGGISLPEGCGCFDTDLDGDLDLVDFADIQVTFTQ